MSLGGAVAVVWVVQPHLGARLRTQRVKSRRDVGVGPARRFEVITKSVAKDSAAPRLLAGVLRGRRRAEATSVLLLYVAGFPGSGFLL